MATCRHPSLSRLVLASMTMASAPAWTCIAANRTVDASAASASVRLAEIAVDPELARADEWDLAALRIEARGRGVRITRDGEVLRGRVVVEGLVVPAGTHAFVAAGTQIICMGDMQLRGELVPIVDDVEVAWRTADAAGGVLDGDAVAPDVDPAGALPDDAIGVGDGAVAMQAANCTARNTPPWIDGLKPPPIVVVFAGRGMVGGTAGCGGPLPPQLPFPPAAVAVGSGGTLPGARAIGGRGGDGVDVTITGLAGSTLAITGAVCNGRGADGAKAIASAADGFACDCGGDAVAIGGDGGDGGRLTIVADTIIWSGPLARAEIQFGGSGGDADATAGNGGSCPCDGAGGDGGDAKAVGGKAGLPGGIRIAARVKMVPAPDVALATRVIFTQPPKGGMAHAVGGLGGPSLACFDCPGLPFAKAGRGGFGGSAVAIGGRGGDGHTLTAWNMGVPLAALGSHAGPGGAALALGKQGGSGGGNGSCPCLSAGGRIGGDGWFGGDGAATGGMGGAADSGLAFVVLATPKSGDGGNANAQCGAGGSGGVGASCGPGFGDLCPARPGGTGGLGGIAKATAGAPGAVSNNAMAGLAGTAVPANPTTCPPGPDGLPGVVICFGSSACCVPGIAPGCPDPLCSGTVCAALPHCCAIAWDQPCADLANEICPVCAAPSNCCVAHPGPGCDDPACSEVVCFVNPLCCDAAWDQPCADLASQVCAVCVGA